MERRNHRRFALGLSKHDGFLKSLYFDDVSSCVYHPFFPQLLLLFDQLTPGEGHKQGIKIEKTNTDLKKKVRL